MAEEKTVVDAICDQVQCVAIGGAAALAQLAEPLPQPDPGLLAYMLQFLRENLISYGFSAAMVDRFIEWVTSLSSMSYQQMLVHALNAAGRRAAWALVFWLLGWMTHHYVPPENQVEVQMEEQGDDEVDPVVGPPALLNQPLVNQPYLIPPFIMDALQQQQAGIVVVHTQDASTQTEPTVRKRKRGDNDGGLEEGELEDSEEEMDEEGEGEGKPSTSNERKRKRY